MTPDSNTHLAPSDIQHSTALKTLSHLPIPRTRDLPWSSHLINSALNFDSTKHASHALVSPQRTHSLQQLPPYPGFGCPRSAYPARCRSTHLLGESTDPLPRSITSSPGFSGFPRSADTHAGGPLPTSHFFSSFTLQTPSSPKGSVVAASHHSANQRSSLAAARRCHGYI